MVDVRRLRNMPEDELMRQHEELMEHRAEHYNVFLDELTRREAVRQGERMEALPRSPNRLTWVIAGATVVGVLLTVLTLIHGG
jgi:hypothetical protein